MKERGERYTQSYGYDVINGKMVQNDREQFMLRKIKTLKDKVHLIMKLRLSKS